MKCGKDIDMIDHCSYRHNQLILGQEDITTNGLDRVCYMPENLRYFSRHVIKPLHLNLSVAVSILVPRSPY